MPRHLKKRAKPVKLKTYKELPGWFIRKFISRRNGALQPAQYDIFKLHKNINYHNSVGGCVGADSYIYMGSLNDAGILCSSHYDGERRFFGKNLKQAIRFLFLKTQQPLK